MFRNNLPQLKSSDVVYLTDGGLETHLIFKKSIDLPFFASVHALRSDETTKLVKEYYLDYAQVWTILIGHLRPLFHFIFGLFNQTLQWYNVKKVHPVSSVGIRTQDLLNVSLLP